MIDINEINALARLKQVLLKTPFAKENSAHTHVIIRCPICGDSLKHQDSVHCYVNIEGNKPVSYYCFSSCSEGHWVNSDFLRAAGVTDLSLLSAVWSHNKKFMDSKARTESCYIIHGSKKSIVPFYKTCSHIDKLKYIEKRLGVELTYQDCVNLKIILSLKDFLDINGFSVNLPIYVAQKLEDDYVGFLSADSSYIIFRDTKKNEHRYINYPVFKNSGNWGSKLYIIPGMYDLMANDIDCNVTEGIFDILGCYYHLNGTDKTNKLYSAVNGAGFLGVIKRILHIGFIDNLNLNIYADADKPIEFFKSLRPVREYCKSINLFYNQYPGEKDLGTTRDHIDIRQAKLVL